MLPSMLKKAPVIKTVKCACGKDLKIKQDNDVLYIQPCEECLSREAYAAYETGYVEGHALVNAIELVN